LFFKRFSSEKKTYRTILSSSRVVETVEKDGRFSVKSEIYGVGTILVASYVKDDKRFSPAFNKKK